MKANYLIFVLLIFILSSLFAADITFSFANEAITNDGSFDYYEFDILAKTSESGNIISDLQVYIRYNTAGFGVGIVNLNGIEVTRGDLITGDLTGTPYYNLGVTDNGPFTNRVAITITHAFANVTSLANEIATTFDELIHVKMKIIEASENSDLELMLTDGGVDLMDNNQYHYPDISTTPAVAFSAVIIENTSDNPLPVTLSTFSGVQDGDCVQLNWVTQSESNNWLWNVYRSNTSDLSSSFQHNGMPIWGAGTTSTPTQYSYLDDEVEDIPVVTYYYWLESVDYNGEAELFGPISLNYFQSEENITAPELKKESLLTSYPNPFNPSTNIGILAAGDTQADLVIYNSKGQLVDTIFKNKYLEKDVYEAFYWDGKSSAGFELPNGIYFAKLVYDNEVKTHRMILLK